MKLARRTNARVIDFSDLTGGVNISKLPSNIGDSELQVCENFLYSDESKILQKRGGLSSPFSTYPSDIKKVYYDPESNRHFVFLANNSCYVSTNFGSAQNIGMLSGTDIPMCAKYDSKLWIASGGKLQYWNGSGGLVTLSDAPFANYVKLREGRIICFKAGDDNVYYSAMGDGTMWDFDSNDDSSASWIEIGYKDDGDLIDAVFMFDDIYFFKTNGMVYKLSGEYPDWVVNIVAYNSGVDTMGSCEHIANEVVLVGRHGFKSLHGISEYGDLNTSDIGDKFNSLVTQGYFHPKVWNIDKHRTLFINNNCGSDLIAYNYELKSATVLKFPFEVVDMFESLTSVVVVSKRSLYYLSRTYLTDDGVPIACRLKTKKLPTIYNYMLITMIDSTHSGSTSGSFDLKISDKLTLPFPNMGRKNYKLNHSVPAIEFELSTTDDLIFDRLSVEVTDI